MALYDRGVRPFPRGPQVGRWVYVRVCKCGARYEDTAPTSAQRSLCGQCGEQEWTDHKRRVGRYAWGPMLKRTWRRLWIAHRPMVWEWKEKR